jgi:hypothetical protein
LQFLPKIYFKRSFVDWKNESEGGKGISEMAAMIKVSQQKGEKRNDIDSGQFAIVINGSAGMLAKQWKMSDYSFDLIPKGEEQINSMK